MHSKARQVQMQKPLTGKCHCQLLILFLLANFLCLLLLQIDCSSIIGSKIDIKFLLKNYVGTYVGNKINMINKQILGQRRVKTKLHEDLCLGRYIYIHNAPAQYNEQVLKNCHMFTKKVEKYPMCVYTVNSGFGPRVENSSGVLSKTSWYLTNQFLLEVIFHHRMKKYECLTNDSSLASAIYVPFYAGLDLRRYLWGFNTSMRDSSGVTLGKWLSEKPEWKRMNGMDHFLVAGRISTDFRRRSDKNSEWGSKFRFLPESENMSMLSIEASSWKNDFAIPYPTYFHPSRDMEVSQWQDRMRKQRRQYLFSFAGVPRPKQKRSIRGNIIDQCLASGSACKFLDCNDPATDCDNPVDVMKVFQSSIFCLQPPGDSFTRRSTFDSMLAGCIPVFFHSGSAYTQYLWHLPKNYTRYSVFIPEEKLRDRRVRINETLVQISKDEESALREEIIRLIPRITYTDHRSTSETLEDAFDLAVKGILDRIERLRESARDGRDPSIGFAERDDSRFYLPVSS